MSAPGRAEQVVQRNNGTARHFSFSRLFDRVAGLPLDDAALCADMLDTAMLRPLGLLTASAGFLLMSVAAVAFTGRSWAIAWVTLDVVVLLARLVPAVTAFRADRRIPERHARLILLVAFAMFATFGVGCAASFANGENQLRLAAAMAPMGLLAGLTTRWAAVPRLASLMMVIVTVPMAMTIGQVSMFAGALFAALGAGTAVLTLQNNRMLLAMLRAEREARRLANTDPLTGLLNRAGLDAELRRFEVENIELVAVLCMDLNGFKGVNDRWGHAAGDHVLVEVGKRLASIGDGHVVARFGGDEFVLLVGHADEAAAFAISSSIKACVEQPIHFRCKSGEVVKLRVGIGVGVGVGSLAHRPFCDLLTEADDNLYALKREHHQALRSARSHSADTELRAA